ncbi:uncharacterized protein LOC134660629 [Cydia amplana]|uniref:uncharacterized protein LOC134660629 n=1 Tax=Cydia amplana TaxID=1869771 RepID=UPI002FE601DF
MKMKFAEFEATLQTASPESDTITTLKAELNKFKDATSAVLDVLRQQIAALSNTVDNLEMRHRRKYILLAGVPESSNENVAEVVAAICQDKLRLAEVSSSSFTACHRLGPAVAGRSRSILVRCSDAVTKDILWRKKTALKGSRVVMSEFLTRQRQAVFIEARRHFGIRSVWTLDGTIFIKTSSGKTHRVVMAEQLHKLIREHPSQTPSSTQRQPVEASKVGQVVTSAEPANANKPAESASRYPKRVK